MLGTAVWRLIRCVGVGPPSPTGEETSPLRKKILRSGNISIQQYRALNYGYTSCKCPHALETWAILSRRWLFFNRVFRVGRGWLHELAGRDVREIPIAEFAQIGGRA